MVWEFVDGIVVLDFYLKSWCGNLGVGVLEGIVVWEFFDGVAVWEFMDGIVAWEFSFELWCSS